MKIEYLHHHDNVSEPYKHKAFDKFIRYSIAYMIDDNNPTVLYYAFSKCNSKDYFNKKIGRSITTTRLINYMVDGSDSEYSGIITVQDIVDWYYRKYCKDKALIFPDPLFYKKELDRIIASSREITIDTISVYTLKNILEEIVRNRIKSNMYE